MTSRQRFLKTCDFETADPPWARGFSGFWPETVSAWRGQGYQAPDLDVFGTGLAERFGLDQFAQVDPWYGPVPEFEYRVVAEDERTKLYINLEGILMREFKEHAMSSMPQFVKFPVTNREEFERLAAERLALNADQRLSEAWRRRVTAGEHVHTGERAAEESPRMCWANRWGGFFGALRNMMGIENLCLAFYDQPDLVERMMEERADRIIEITAEVLKVVDFDVFWYWEDMAFNHGPLIDPKMFRRFALKHYRRVNDWLHSQGIRIVGLDSDGDIHKLIPIWLDSGINMLWPFEVQAGMDVLDIRRTYGHDLIIGGGIDKRALIPGGDVMRREVDRVMPLVTDGGYLPELDHSVPPDVSWPNFVEYVEYLKLRLGRG
jgi:uroporphyrinogen decarboxylase